ncbi:hypothetical protein AAG570_003245 [Ranatra chinensis]|uniref:Uncharacterized protein n=1 Tax=Ranatra chinensis TaxID=642074 RepID=A0ABD0Y6B4_9HEMI
MRIPPEDASNMGSETSEPPFVTTRSNPEDSALLTVHSLTAEDGVQAPKHVGQNPPPVINAYLSEDGFPCERGHGRSREPQLPPGDQRTCLLYPTGLSGLRALKNDLATRLAKTHRRRHNHRAGHSLLMHLCLAPPPDRPSLLLTQLKRRWPRDLPGATVHHYKSVSPMADDGDRPKPVRNDELGAKDDGL